MIMNFGVFIRSVLYLTPSMVYWRVHRSLKSIILMGIETTGLGNMLFAASKPPRHINLPRLSSKYHCEDIRPEDGVFTFLNDTVELPTSKALRIAAVTKQPLLWQFHYGYHDYLLALLQNDEQNEALKANVLSFMRRWLEDYPLSAPGARKSAWHPYVLSIRIESWIRLSSRFPDEDFISRHIYQMARVLRRNMEFGTMANHLMKNIKALVLAGVYFEGKKGPSFLDYGVRLLRREIKEQVLQDGMHFERSPMYHVAMTSDVIDLYEALGDRAPDSLGQAAKAMTQFLSRVVHPDAEVPFFNDSTASFFLKTSEVLSRGLARFGSTTARRSSRLGEMTPYKLSGLLHFHDSLFHGIIDLGDVGPDYQPGHAHCDTLSFELSVNNRRFITDTGVFHYKESPEREWSRCTSAHNTLKIDNVEQSEVWKSFRVGRRAMILSANSFEQNGLHVFTGIHDGYLHVANNLFHERFVVVSPSQWIAVVDIVHGSQQHDLESNLHAAPDVQIATDDQALLLTQGADVRARLSTTGFYASMQPQVHLTEYYPAFGKKLLRDSITWTGRNELPAIGGFILTFSGETPRVEYSSQPMKFRILSTQGTLYESATRLS